jgi:hypothetical protein
VNGPRRGCDADAAAGRAADGTAWRPAAGADYPAGSDEDATCSSQAAFRDELVWHMRLYASLQAINETPDPQRLAFYDTLYAKILTGLKE